MAVRSIDRSLQRRKAAASSRIARMMAGDVAGLLEERHHNDVFVAECKDGPTWNGSHLRLDGWAMLKTRSPPTTIGYEIKVSRGDWLNDQKVAGYLPLCHQLYIVAPDGVVDQAELPPECGLLRVTSGGKRLLTVKKAPYRNIEWPGDLLAYILMSRATITRDRFARTPDEGYWRDWLATREEEREIGHRVSRSLAARYRRDVLDIKSRLEASDRDRQRIEDAIDAIKRKTGIDLRELGGWSAESMAQRFAERLEAFPPECERSLTAAKEAIERAMTTIERRRPTVEPRAPTFPTSTRPSKAYVMPETVWRYLISGRSPPRRASRTPRRASWPPADAGCTARSRP